MSTNDEQDWLVEAFGGFRRPFGMLWLQVRYWLICVFWGILAGLPIGIALGFSAPFARCFAESALALTVAVVTVVTSVGVAAALAIYSVPFYRYRFLWLVKAEHPDWSAGECIRSCRTLTEGHKMESFRLDCSYWRPITLVMLLMLTVAFVIGLAPTFVKSWPVVTLLVIVALLAFAACFVAVIVLAQYIGVGQGFFYLDLKDGRTAEQ